ncbi:MAG: carbamoyl-phosphate synthase large subunit [Thermoguttaceae bacterium]
MPKRNDIKKIMIIGSGPIIIGQACEFDYSGVQACKALREEGYEIVLINSNPATIMTDPGLANRTYIEPLTPEFVEKIIEIERPCAILPTLGGQTALNLAMALHKNGVLKKFAVEMIGASPEVIAKAEEREQFKQAMNNIGLAVTRGETVRNVDNAFRVLDEIGLPCVIRPSFTMGGSGSAIAYNREDFDRLVRRALFESPVNEVLLEEAILGWKEYEMEVVRDKADNAVIVCSIENFDPIGIHTGDSITIAPAQTLTDKEFQKMRNASLAVIREIGVETGGANIQFAVNPESGRMVVIEMNPRVSRSSALASKATGFPIAKIAAKLAIGYTLPELRNDITQKTCACFEPSIDYIVTKIPRFAFEKFPEANDELTTQMKSVGETMAIGRTFKESLQKAIRGLEVGANGLGNDNKDLWDTRLQPSLDDVKSKISRPTPWRLFYLRYAIKYGLSIDKINYLTGIDPWFLQQLYELVEKEQILKKYGTLENIDANLMKSAKRDGFSDKQLACIFGTDEIAVRSKRKDYGVVPVYKAVDTCAAEFEAFTPYYYSTYDEESELPKPSGKKRVLIIGGGPNRIGQGIEFDYCCCHASFAVRKLGMESIMVNSNPETVSTDYDTSDFLFFEPLTLEDILNLNDAMSPDGVIVQFGGQTPLNLSQDLVKHGVPVIGTNVESIAMAEDREIFSDIIAKIGIKQPTGAIAHSVAEAQVQADKIGFPVLVRPSFVLGGRAMEICYDARQFDRIIGDTFNAAEGKPVLIDHFLEDAIEVDVDAISDGTNVIVAGIMEHIEAAGIHSGDSACTIPPQRLDKSVLQEIRDVTVKLAHVFSVKGLMNVQYAIKQEEGKQLLYVLEVNPRASRTVPFVSKSVDMPVADIATQVMLGKMLPELGVISDPTYKRIAVKEAVFPFAKFAGVDTVLGPEMRSTGEVMGSGENFAEAFAKSQIAAMTPLPMKGNIFISVNDKDKSKLSKIASSLVKMGYILFASAGTARVIDESGIPVVRLRKIAEGHPNILDFMINGEVNLIINTPKGKGARTDEGKIRAAAVIQNIPCVTTIQAAQATVHAMESLHNHNLSVKCLQN